MNKYFIYIVLMSIACMTVSCDRQMKPKNGILCKSLFIRLGGPDENYLIEVTSDSIIRVSSGLLSSDFYGEILLEDRKLKGNLSDFNFFEEVRMQTEKKLRPEEFDTLKTCISDIEDIDNLVNPFIQSNWHDTWAAVIIVGEKKYVFVYIPNPELKKFLNTIMTMSPVELKDEYNNRNLRFSYIDDNPSYIEAQPYKKTLCERVKDWFD
ncbi:MAG: hypothetical protein KHX42_11475 [Prevotella sp.]|nr:hypothetical protein [Prevotella sp.]